MKLFWGLVNIPMWGYYDGYTAAQIELMATDCPITVYDRRNEKGNKGKPPALKVSADRIKQMEAEWKRKYANGTEVKFDFSDYELK